MTTANSWQQQARIQPMSKADFELAWTLADFHQQPGFQGAMNGHALKGLLARLLIEGVTASSISERCMLKERQRQQLLAYAKNLHAQLFPRVGEMFVDDSEGAPARRIRLSPVH